ncbi:MAG: HlyD family efflux transporter periplasmic adaptor subunit, partial [Tabrizicola sp.]|nr:HlyD family efflux transporter periplasmic adaptor subunit [Tabrizicola sp.]
EAAEAAASAAVDLARAHLAQADATREYATSEADRARTLFDRATLSKQVLDNAVLAQRTAEAMVASAKANLAVRERERDSARAVLAAGNGNDACCIEIVTPVAGRILRVATEDEQVVQAGTPILQIGNPAALEIAVELLSRDAVRATVGAVARIYGWGGPDLEARVDRIEPAAVTKVSALGIEEQRVEVILSLGGDPKTWQALGHGFRVLAGLRIWEGKDVLTIPVGALFRDGSDWAAFVVRDGRALLSRIVIGERNDSFAQVLQGLEAGDLVVLHPSDAVSGGVRVQPLP